MAGFREDFDWGNIAIKQSLKSEWGKTKEKRLLDNGPKGNKKGDKKGWKKGSEGKGWGEGGQKGSQNGEEGGAVIKISRRCLGVI